MADDVDIANDIVTMATDIAIRAAGAATIPINDTGLCWGCGDPIAGGKRWHTAECREYWESDNRK